jgi:hypothetical protein
VPGSFVASSMKPRFATIFWSKASFESVAPVITERQSGAVANNAALVEDDLALVNADDGP